MHDQGWRGSFRQHELSGKNLGQKNLPKTGLISDQKVA